MAAPGRVARLLCGWAVAMLRACYNDTEQTMHGMQKRLVLLAAVLTLLAGCGNKGPLYLPDNNTPPPQQPQGR